METKTNLWQTCCKRKIFALLATFLNFWPICLLQFLQLFAALHFPHFVDFQHLWEFLASLTVVVQAFSYLFAFVTCFCTFDDILQLSAFEDRARQRERERERERYKQTGFHTKGPKAICTSLCCQGPCPYKPRQT